MLLKKTNGRNWFPKTFRTIPALASGSSSLVAFSSLLMKDDRPPAKIPNSKKLVLAPFSWTNPTSTLLRFINNPEISTVKVKLEFPARFSLNFRLKLVDKPPWESRFQFNHPLLSDFLKLGGYFWPFWKRICEWHSGAKNNFLSRSY